MKIQEILWNRDAERGTILALIFAFIWMAITGSLFGSGPNSGSDTSLYLDWKNGNVPYGVLWTWLNPYWETQQPYIFLVSCVTGSMYLFQYWLVRKGKLSKNLVLMNFFSTVFFNVTHVWQEGTKIMFGPLVAINPLFVIPMILQIFPFGWSWDFSDKHWACGIQGECVDFYNHRLDIARSDFITHIAMVFWMVAPLFIWWRNRTGKMPFEGVFKWAERHWKILLIVWFGFMMFLTVYAWWHNGDFWRWCTGDGC